MKINTRKNLMGIVLSVVVASCADKKETAKAETSEKAKARAEYIEVEPNVRLHVTDMGEGKPVVLIHGYPLSDAMWEYQNSALVKAGYRVIAITLRGFGQSDKPYGSYNYDQFADDIKVVLDKLEIENATIGGHSMGGAIALHYVAKFDSLHVSKLALFSAAAPKHTKVDGFEQPFFSKEDITAWVGLMHNDRPALLAAVSSKFTLNETSVNPGLGGWLYQQEMQSSPYAMEQALIALRDEDLRADLPKIKIPTLIFSAVQDHIVSHELGIYMSKNIASSKLVVFENSGHAGFVEEKDKFNAEFIKFLNEAN
ncbi:alpha/beta hydrolase [Flavobacterium sp.]|uniref:alpha/beta fold hydrolase n=1 Tax=Flavobacterium sp. TaxID=239 RepID=UPI0025C649FB|nr:alpha/beta hydrolase [Flavobacterium sp.]